MNASFERKLLRDAKAHQGFMCGYRFDFVVHRMFDSSPLARNFCICLPGLSTWDQMGLVREIEM